MSQDFCVRLPFLPLCTLGGIAAGTPEAQERASAGAALSEPVRRMVMNDPQFVEFLRRQRRAAWEYSVKAAEERAHALMSAVAIGGDSESADDGTSGDSAPAAAGPAGSHTILLRHTHPAWCDEAMTEYLRRQRRLRATPSSRLAVVLLVCVAVVAGMWSAWPLWHVLLGVRANEHYETLQLAPGATRTEVAKAYREMTRKWHPDRNPGCGQRCQTQMLQIQHAYDVLREKDDAGEFRKQTEALLSQITAFTYGESVPIALRTGETILVLVERLGVLLGAAGACSRMLNTVEPIVKATLILTALISVLRGVDFMMILVVGFNVVTQWNSFPREAGGGTFSGWFRFRGVADIRDILLSILIFAVPALATQLWFDDFDIRSVFGLMYVVSSTYIAPPNLLDNMATLSVTLPLEILTLGGPEPQLTKLGLLHFILVRFVIPDILAFSVGVYWAYRAAAWTALGLFCLQLWLRPWSFPLGTTPRARIAMAADARLMECAPAERPATSAASTSGDTDECVSGTLYEDGARAQRLRQQIPAEDQRLLANLDGEVPNWLEMCMLHVAAKSGVIADGTAHPRMIEICLRDTAGRIPVTTPPTLPSRIPPGLATELQRQEQTGQRIMPYGKRYWGMRGMDAQRVRDELLQACF